MYKKSVLIKYNLCTFSSLCFYGYSEPCHLQHAPKRVQIRFNMFQPTLWNMLHIFAYDELRIILVTAHHVVSSFIHMTKTDLLHPDGRPSCLKDVKLWVGVDGWTYISWSPSLHITNYATNSYVLTYIQHMWKS